MNQSSNYKLTNFFLAILCLKCVVKKKNLIQKIIQKLLHSSYWLIQDFCIIISKLGPLYRPKWRTYRVLGPEELVLVAFAAAVFMGMKLPLLVETEALVMLLKELLVRRL